MSSLLPFVEKGSSDKPVIVFLSGFPDNQLSGWGDVVPQEMSKTHRLIFLCMPDFQKDLKQFKKWGYSFESILEMMHSTLVSLNVTKSKFQLVGHDWGAFLALKYENLHPELIKKLVLLDVGMLKPQNAPFKDLLIILLYQFWFAIAYIIGQIFGTALGDLAFMLSLPVLKVAGPCPHDKSTIPVKDMSVHKCYPYYHFWRSQFLMKFKDPRFPTAPLLFMYGTRKNCMFHDKKFLNRIDTSTGGKHRSFDAGHWFAMSHGEEVVKELQAFFKE